MIFFDLNIKKLTRKKPTKGYLVFVSKKNQNRQITIIDFDIIIQYMKKMKHDILGHRTILI